MTNAQDFTYRSFFPTLTDAQINAALEIVNATWYGAIYELWAALPASVQEAKRNAIQNLLVASWLADNYPGTVEGGISNGALPLTSKSVDGVSLAYKDLENVQGELKTLMTNQWGIQALRMYLSAPERFTVFAR